MTLEECNAWMDQQHPEGKIPSKLEVLPHTLSLWRYWYQAVQGRKLTQADWDAWKSHQEMRQRQIGEEEASVHTALRQALPGSSFMVQSFMDKNGFRDCKVEQIVYRSGNPLRPILWRAKGVRADGAEVEAFASRPERALFKLAL